MRALIFTASMLAVLIGAATLSGCQSYRIGTDGRRYHVGDEWTAYKIRPSSTLLTPSVNTGRHPGGY